MKRVMLGCGPSLPWQEHALIKTNREQIWAQVPNNKLTLLFLDLTHWRNEVKLKPNRVNKPTACDPEPAHVAQPVEHTLGKGVAMGSNPIVGSGLHFITDMVT